MVKRVLLAGVCLLVTSQVCTAQPGMDPLSMSPSQLRDYIDYRIRLLLSDARVDSAPPIVEQSRDAHWATPEVEPHISPTSSGVRAPSDSPAADESLHDLTRRFARHYGVPEHLAIGLVTVESAFVPDAVSPGVGATGLAQVLPSTAEGIGFDCDLTEPACSLAAGFTYLRAMLDRFGDERLALAAYHAGPAVFDRPFSAAGREGVKAYVRKVIRASNAELEE